ncbi:MAG: acyltransferase [Provencibacterium sp.]|jgi:peptidoglycan/LPS O-acetylase OafA/YrhL|nr:acyltransferase [Provencibacterium sp.]
MEPSSRNNSIELWRFCFAIGVAIMHFGYYNGFYIAVDFFFMLSGFLLVKSIEKRPQQSVLDIFLNKIRTIYPHYILSFLCLFVLLFYSRMQAGVFRDINFWADSLLEILCLQMIYPLSNAAVNGVTWYISVLLIWTPLITWLIKYHRSIFTHALAPYGTFAIYAFFLSNWQHIDFGFVWLGHINGGLLRGLAGIMLGCLIYESYIYIYGKKFRFLEA